MNVISGAQIRPSAKQAVVEAEQEMHEEGLDMINDRIEAVQEVLYDEEDLRKYEEDIREYVEEFHPDEVVPRVDDSGIYRGLVEEMQDEEYQDFHSGVGVDGYNIETSSLPRVSDEFGWMFNPMDYID